jgi:hypothetical protein
MFVKMVKNAQYRGHFVKMVNKLALYTILQVHNTRCTLHIYC